MSTVPHSKVILGVLLAKLQFDDSASGRALKMTYGNTREKTSLGKTEENAGDEEAGVVLNDSHECHDKTPGKHNDGQPSAWAELLEQQVTRHLKGRISKEKDGQTPVVLVICHVQILLETLNLGISDVSTWSIV
jgi:hypothetical protein